MIVFVPKNQNGVEGQPFVNEADALEYIADLAGWTVESKNIPDIEPLPNWAGFEDTLFSNDDFRNFFAFNCLQPVFTMITRTIADGRIGNAKWETLEALILSSGVTFTGDNLTLLNATLTANHFPFQVS